MPAPLPDYYDSSFRKKWNEKASVRKAVKTGGLFSTPILYLSLFIHLSGVIRQNWIRLCTYKICSHAVEWILFREIKPNPIPVTNEKLIFINSISTLMKYHSLINYIMNVQRSYPRYRSTRMEKPKPNCLIHQCWTTIRSNKIRFGHLFG